MKILIEIPTWLGDSVMITPSLENLVDGLQCNEVSFIGPKHCLELFKNFPKAVNFIEISRDFLGLKQALTIGSYDIFVSFRDSIRSKIFKTLIRSKRKFNFNKAFFSGHQVEKYNSYVDSITNKVTKPKSLKLYQKDKKSKKSKIVVGINPGAAYGSAKRWTKDGFIKVSLKLSESNEIVLFGGSSETDICNYIEEILNDHGRKSVRNLAGKTSISELMREISDLDLFITGDSGPMHIAAAFQIPTVSIFGPTKHLETSQWMNNKSIVIKKDLDCQPCMKRECPLGHHQCMKLITPEEVITKSLNLI